MDYSSWDHKELDMTKRLTQKNKHVFLGGGVRKSIAFRSIRPPENQKQVIHL